MTADHCFTDKNEISDFEYWMLLFNYVAACGNDTSPAVTQVIQVPALAVLWMLGASKHLCSTQCLDCMHRKGVVPTWGSRAPNMMGLLCCRAPSFSSTTALRTSCCWTSPAPSLTDISPSMLVRPCVSARLRCLTHIVCLGGMTLHNDEDISSRRPRLMARRPILLCLCL